MKHWLCAVFFTVLASCSLAQAASFPLDASLTIGDTIIRYPKELEAQAQEVAKVCAEVLPPRQEALQRYLAAQNKMAERVVALLGCPEEAQAVRENARRHCHCYRDDRYDA